MRDSFRLTHSRAEDERPNFTEDVLPERIDGAWL